MKIRLVLLAFLFGLLWPGWAWSAAACLPEDCDSGGRPVNAESFCERYPPLNSSYCVQRWVTVYPPCDNECRYSKQISIIDTEGTVGLECDADATIANNCKSSTAYIGPGTCCVDQGGGGGGGVCPDTAPGNVRNTFLTNRRVKIDWNPTTPLTAQHLYFGTSKTEVNRRCPGGVGLDQGCQIGLTELGKSLSTYTSANNTLLAGAIGRVYWTKIYGQYTQDCLDSTMVSDISACPVNPTSMTLNVGQSRNISVNIEDNAEIDRSVQNKWPDGENPQNPTKQSQFLVI
ncbi:MAG: hypothetical protein ACOYY3_06940 [Chloroflexota bacterium]